MKRKHLRRLRGPMSVRTISMTMPAAGPSEENRAAALRHECPTCGRAPRSACITAGGARMTNPHIPRLRRAGWTAPQP
ncbi:zinc finger domain-containing protein [Streptacidiphilus alkalitolerans]